MVYLSPNNPSLMLPGTSVAGNHSVLTAVFFKSSQLDLTAVIACVIISKFGDTVSKHSWFTRSVLAVSSV